ncbi:transcription elongation factor GreA [candidate division WWE3 bacterium RIFCSPLOWO2_01_FULL_42_11]|uniref:Transcription elongation factor GreA n=1 Tax=candidate division WWE3 bacterium RIFCSPLOWO2_01_FULL_42_11 TaxID=1802627 RepID=A0A1F4VMJ8_UNCKA|nr:MAG: transcription elongation factor GreA [candidate division WWE3 bacterium RIFCSPLOWO2_01_FULL_42_11]
MVTTKILLTKEGFQNLKDEYKSLVDVKRTEIAEKIQSAREMGDLSENAAYHTAKEEQAFLEGRVSELEELFRNAEVVEKDNNKTSVGIGSKVKVCIDGGDETFWIVGAYEADPAVGKISHESPIGQALLGKKIGEEINVEAPIGTVKYKIVSIE